MLDKIIIMQTRQSFKIEAWDSEDPFVPISHRHQLRGLQNLIARTKPNHQSIKNRQLKINPKPQQSHEQCSFLSLRSNRKKCHTEEIRKEHQPPQQHEERLRTQHHSVTQKQVQGYPQQPTKKKELSKDCFHKTKQACIVFRNIMSLIEKEPSAQSQSPKIGLKHITNFDAHIDAIKKRSRSFEHIFQTKKNEAKSLKNRCKLRKVNKVQVHSQECLVILPHLSKDQKMKELKSFFLKTIKGIEKNRLLAEHQQQQIRNNDYRWKKIVGKSNRKKKDLQDLFKTRAIFTKKDLEKAANQTKEKLFQTKWRPRPPPVKKLNDEFDDQSLYCPWYYREDRLVDHLKSKEAY